MAWAQGGECEMLLLEEVVGLIGSTKNLFKVCERTLTLGVLVIISLSRCEIHGEIKRQ